MGSAGRGAKLRQRHLHHIALWLLLLLNVHESARARGIGSPAGSRSLHGRRVRRAARLTKVRQHDPTRTRICRLEATVAMLVKAERGGRRSGGMRLSLKLLELALLVLLVRGVAELVRDVAPRERVLLCKVADHGDLCLLLNRAGPTLGCGLVGRVQVVDSIGALAGLVELLATVA